MYLFFSDIDGTLLDHDSYSYELSMPGILMLRERRMPLVLVSSKTCAEMQELHDGLQLDAPFVFENGGGIRWHDGRVELPGSSFEELHALKGQLEAAVGAEVRLITDMEVGDIVTLTGLTQERAALARERIASLPFIIPSGKKMDATEMTRINKDLESRSVAITRGGRFYHFISRNSDKGSAVGKIAAYYRRTSVRPVTTVGIGDSENDVPMLAAVDIPFVVKKKSGVAIDTGLNTARETSGVGPAGFTEAVQAVLGA